jgi:SAM-dependent methyltransferase
MGYVKCAICGVDDSELFLQAKEALGLTSESFTLIRCRRCGLIYLNPQPSFEELEPFYPDHYWYQKEHRFANKLQELLKKGEEIIITALLLPAVNGLKKVVKPGGRILDVGCGNGQILHLCRKYGFETYGVDTSSVAANYARKEYAIEVYNGDLLEARYPPGHFDAVTFYGVFEHLHDPIGILGEASRILKDTGLLVVEVPNIDSFQSKLFKGRWNGLSIPTHLYHYSLRTIKRLLNQLDFEVISVNHFSLRRNPAAFVCSLLPTLNPPLLRLREIQGKSSTWAKILYLVLQICFLPFATFESLLHHGAVITVYARKVSSQKEK